MSFFKGSLTVESLGMLSRLSDTKPALLPVGYWLVGFAIYIVVFTQVCSYIVCLS